MRYLITTICIVLFLWGCDNAAAVPEKPVVVRKKITTKKTRTAKVRSKKVVRTAKTKPDAKQQTRRIVAKPDNPRPTPSNKPPVKQNNSSKPRIAKKAKPAPVQTNPVSRLKQKKPAISPKSDLTDIKPIRSKGGKAVAGKKSKFSRLLTASIDLPGNVPPRYNPKGKVDPFDPLIKDRSVMAKKGKKI